MYKDNNTDLRKICVRQIIHVDRLLLKQVDLDTCIISKYFSFTIIIYTDFTNLVAVTVVLTLICCSKLSNAFRTW